MKTLIVALSLLVSATAWAEWTLIDSQDSDKTYIDLPTIRKDGNLRKVWSLLSSNKTDKDGVMSKRVHFEYDCKNYTYRIMNISHHGKEMAGGDVLLNEESSDKTKTSIPPSSISARIFNIVCTKK